MTPPLQRERLLLGFLFRGTTALLWFHFGRQFEILWHFGKKTSAKNVSPCKREPLQTFWWGAILASNCRKGYSPPDFCKNTAKWYKTIRFSTYVVPPILQNVPAEKRDIFRNASIAKTDHHDLNSYWPDEFFWYFFCSIASHHVWNLVFY